jgi:Protein of unknown function (DUF664)
MTEYPWEPPLAGTEVQQLTGALDRLRTTFRWKADDLTVTGLQARFGASSLTLGGLLKHLAMVEDYIFTVKLRGEPLGAPWDALGSDGSDDWEFTSAAKDSPTSSTGSGTVLSSGPVTGSALPWPTAASTSWCTSPARTAATPACAGSSAT